MSPCGRREAAGDRPGRGCVRLDALGAGSTLGDWVVVGVADGQDGPAHLPVSPAGGGRLPKSPGERRAQAGAAP